MKALITLIILATVGWGAYAFMNKDERPAPASTNQEALNEEGHEEGEEKSFTVSGSNFSFSPASMRVKEGDRVRITFANQSGTHDLVVEGYNARTKILSGGQSETIEFVADKAGTFEYYCSVGNHRQMGMTGTLIVE